MRKIEKEMIAAIRRGEGFTQGNTAVLWNESRNAFYVSLFGNTIARGEIPWDSDGTAYKVTAVNLCGWNKSTTRSRLRALGVPVTTKGGTPYIGKNEIPEDGWTELFG